MNSDLTPKQDPADQPRKRLSLMAVVSLLTGALSYLLIFFHSLIGMKFLLAAILAPLSALFAIVTGHRASREIRRGEGSVAGKKLSRTGLILGYGYIAICILLVVLTIFGVTQLLSALGIK